MAARIEDRRSARGCSSPNFKIGIRPCASKQSNSYPQHNWKTTKFLFRHNFLFYATCPVQRKSSMADREDDEDARSNKRSHAVFAAEQDGGSGECLWTAKTGARWEARHD